MLTVLVGLVILKSQSSIALTPRESAPEIAEPILHQWILAKISDRTFKRDGKKFVGHVYALEHLGLKQAFEILKPELAKRGWRVKFAPFYAEDSGGAMFIAAGGRKIVLSDFIDLDGSDLQLSEYAPIPLSSAKRP
jgi:hypothetical protein